ncbi:MAG TPA: GGDEF domain-containing protein, partial [Gammaproteobacteria bacterium]|nr:GGDEF domain-containing protein [Gammaproteobacteria bacterium]
LLPLILELTLIHNYIYKLFNFTAIVYYLFLVIVSFNIHNIIRNVIYLQFENDTLLKKLHHHATHDTLTDIDNTRQFYANLSYAIEQSAFAKNEFTLLFIDLDHFKDVNDNYGHEMGDKLLMRVALRLKNIIRNADFVARIGGDEFTVILWKLSDKEHITKIAKKICYNLNEPFEIDNHIFHVSASVGISIFPEDGNDTINIMKAADSAMYYVKKHGKNNFYFASDLAQETVVE